MIEKIKYIYELQKYGFQRKTQLVSMLIMYVSGLVMEVVSHGTYWLGMFFMMMSPLFVTQTLYSICMSGLVAASPRGKQIQTSLACLGDLVTTLVSMSILVVLKIVEVKVYPDHARVVLSAFVILCLIMIILHLYTALVYKYYALSIILLCAIICPISYVMGYQSVGESSFVLSFVPASPGLVILFAYASALVGVGLEYLIAKLVYRAPLSKYAQGAAMRKYLKN